MTDTAIDTAIRILRDATQACRQRHPELGLSFGYIGNLEWCSGRDDRVWSVITKLSKTPAASACNVSWGHATTDDLERPALAVRRGELLCWVDKQATLLANGELFQVNPGGWLDAEIAKAAAEIASVRPATGL